MSDVCGAGGNSDGGGAGRGELEHEKDGGENARRRQSGGQQHAVVRHNLTLPTHHSTRRDVLYTMVPLNRQCDHHIARNPPTHAPTPPNAPSGRQKQPGFRRQAPQPLCTAAQCLERLLPRGPSQKPGVKCTENRQRNGAATDSGVLTVPALMENSGVRNVSVLCRLLCLFSVGFKA